MYTYSFCNKADIYIYIWYYIRILGIMHMCINMCSDDYMVSFASLMRMNPRTCMHAYIHRQIDRHTQTQMDIDRHRQTQIDIDRYIDIQIDTQIHRYTDTQILYIDTQIHAYMDAYMHTSIHTFRQTDIYIDRYLTIHLHMIQIDIQIQLYRYAHMCVYIIIYCTY